MLRGANTSQMQFGVNHLGHFVFTGLLADLLQRTQQSRVINVASAAHLASQGIDYNRVVDHDLYSQWGSYADSKLANVLFTKELQRRFDAEGAQVACFSLHPGAVNTDLPRYLIEGTPKPVLLLLAPIALFVRSVERGASTQVR